MDTWNGIEIVQNPELVLKFRVKRHRKKRIDKKWLKRYGYRTVPDKQVYLYTGDIDRKMLIVHPYYYWDLLAALHMNGGKPNVVHLQEGVHAVPGR